MPGTAAAEVAVGGGPRWPPRFGLLTERGRKPLWLTRVAVRALGAPPGVAEPLPWLRGTTAPARTQKQLRAGVRAAALRWRIEDVHRTGQQGCRVEQLPLETRQRWAKALVW